MWYILPPGMSCWYWLVLGSSALKTWKHLSSWGQQKTNGPPNRINDFLYERKTLPSELYGFTRPMTTRPMTWHEACNTDYSELSKGSLFHGLWNNPPKLTWVYISSPLVPAPLKWGFNELVSSFFPGDLIRTCLKELVCNPWVIAQHWHMDSKLAWFSTEPWLWEKDSATKKIVSNLRQF